MDSHFINVFTSTRENTDTSAVRRDFRYKNARTSEKMDESLEIQPINSLKFDFLYIWNGM